MANLTDSEIRASTRAAIVDGSTSCGDRVYVSRMVPNGTVDGAGDPLVELFPFALVYILKESKRAISMSRSEFEATTTVAVEVHALVPAGTALDDDALDAALDPLKIEIEDALLASDWPDQLDLGTVETVIRLAGNGNTREVLALLTFTGTHYKTYFRELPATMLDTIGGTVQIPTAADLLIPVDLT